MIWHFLFFPSIFIPASAPTHYSISVIQLMRTRQSKALAQAQAIVIVVIFEKLSVDERCGGGRVPTTQ